MSFQVNVWMSIQHQYSEIHIGHSVLHNVVHMPMQCVDIRGKYGDWLLTKNMMLMFDSLPIISWWQW